MTPIAKLDQARGGNGNGAAAAPHVPHVDEEECVGCNLCSLVCPVEECITMEKVETGKPKRKLGAAHGRARLQQTGTIKRETWETR